VQEAFGYVVFGVVILSAIAAVASLFLRRRTYEQIGAGGFFRDAEDGAPARAESAADRAERDEEIRQLLRARNARHAAAGGEIVDVEAELVRLTTPAVDPELEAEVREFVLRRNERLVARGKPPLDVEAEVARRLGEG